MSSNPKPILPKQHSSSPPDSVSSSTNVLGNNNGRTNLSGGGGGGCRRKIAFHPTLGYAIPPPQPAKVARRNARERNRVKQVNSGFEVLRVHIPVAAKNKKMSKVDTLRHAVEYIQSLQRMLGGGGSMGTPTETNGTEIASDSCEEFGVAEDSCNSHSNIPSPLNIMEPPSSATSSPMASTPYSSGEQNHFQYPLPPRTPGTPSAIASGSDHYSCQFNESGYETSSYYSSSSSSSSSAGSSMISPTLIPSSSSVVLPPPPPLISSLLASNPGPRPRSGNNNSQQQQQHQHQMPHQGYQAYPEHHGGSMPPMLGQPHVVDPYDHSEDELLDVIAKWQDQED